MGFGEGCGSREIGSKGIRVKGAVMLSESVSWTEESKHLFMVRKILLLFWPSMCRGGEISNFYIFLLDFEISPLRPLSLKQ